MTTALGASLPPPIEEAFGDSARCWRSASILRNTVGAFVLFLLAKCRIGELDAEHWPLVVQPRARRTPRASVVQIFSRKTLAAHEG